MLGFFKKIQNIKLCKLKKFKFVKVEKNDRLNPEANRRIKENGRKLSGTQQKPQNLVKKKTVA
jgi:hypothetical protein